MELHAAQQRLVFAYMEQIFFMGSAMIAALHSGKVMRAHSKIYDKTAT